MNYNNHLIIMAGGIGSRFWPLSTPEMPKQFIDILGNGKTMIQMTAHRFSDVIPSSNIWVVTSKKYKNIVLNQIPQIPEDQVLLEPCMRNTAPCIAYVSYKIREKYPDANLVFSPADHIISDKVLFTYSVEKALAFTSDSEAIVTLGMNPDRPETGYGYILASDTASSEIVKVNSFKEKPDLDTAKQYLEEGNYYWNAGIFVWNVKNVIASFEEFLPEVASRFQKLSDDGVFYSKHEQEVIDEVFPNCPNISIDYAVMEKSKNTYVLPASFGWSDLGTFGSLYEHLNKDSEGNAVVGKGVKLVECKECIIHTASESKVVLQGLSNCIVVESEGKLLVCKMEKEQKIKEWGS
jgi:mannose-1-phosphate guanylyltransferase